MPPHVEADRRQSVLDAASRCFEDFGIAKTSMGDVASRAGVSRQALYRLFPDRQALVDAVVQQRVEELVEKVLPQALSSDSFAHAFVDGAIAGIAFVRSTPDLRRLLRETSIDDAARSMLGPDTELRKLTARLWQPILDWGRQRGEVNDQLNDADFIEWTATFILVYAAREDIPLEHLRDLVHDYLLPLALAR